MTTATSPIITREPATPPRIAVGELMSRPPCIRVLSAFLRIADGSSQYLACLEEGIHEAVFVKKMKAIEAAHGVPLIVGLGEKSRNGGKRRQLTPRGREYAEEIRCVVVGLRVLVNDMRRRSVAA